MTNCLTVSEATTPAAKVAGKYLEFGKSLWEDGPLENAVATEGGQRKLPVIAIDPAPGKKSTIFDGKDFLSKNGPELRSYLDQFKRTPETLLCWDAPLTGPCDPAYAGKPGDFTQRLIEGFLRRKFGFQAPKGVSVLGYGRCPHWTITRSLLGLPRTGPYDLDLQHLPFRLLPDPDSEQADRPSVVEIHPAVAAWLWCRKDRIQESWNYKKDDGVQKELWSILLERTGFPWDGRPTPGNDDEFDAAVGYILGSLYLKQPRTKEEEPCVKILGDRCTGSFLLPADPELEERWRAFLEHQ